MEITIGTPYEDPRGKMFASGDREHVFAFMHGAIIETKREWSDDIMPLYEQTIEKWFGPEALTDIKTRGLENVLRLTGVPGEGYALTLREDGS